MFTSLTSYSKQMNGAHITDRNFCIRIADAFKIEKGEDKQDVLTEDLKKELKETVKMLKKDANYEEKLIVQS